MILETEVGDEGKRARMETLNMSAGGFSCHSDEPLEPLTRLHLTLDFPPFGTTTAERRSVDCAGVVVRCEPARLGDGAKGYEMAACFTWMKREDRRLLAEYLHWYGTVYGNREPDLLQMRRTG
jgi:hypothetical protein